jgi:hypothetical protein
MQTVRDQSKRKACRVCGRPRPEGELYSARGLCGSCSTGRLSANMEAMRNPSDPAWWASWRRGMAASIGLQVPEPTERIDP